ncbi:MAG: hypothetical protein AB7G37_03365 [Solirubrobacteraceae bacterium]
MSQVLIMATPSSTGGVAWLQVDIESPAQIAPMIEGLAANVSYEPKRLWFCLRRPRSQDTLRAEVEAFCRARW